MVSSAAALGATYPIYSSMGMGLLPSVLPPGFGPPRLPGPPSAQPPCTDPLCRDPSCPTTALRNAHAAAMMGFPPSPYMYPGALAPPPPPSAAMASPFVCNWMNQGEFCGRRFSSSEELMGHLRTHTSSAVTTTSPATPPTSVTATPTLAALQAAQAHALFSSQVSNGTSALAALQAQAAKMATPPTTTAAPPTTTSADLAAAAAARYHPYARPGGIPHLGALGMPVPPPAALPPHLASYYGFGAVNPYLQMMFPMP
jgi:hypothetical protein